jgi:predicted membrane-bound spermidine synthase
VGKVELFGTVFMTGAAVMTVEVVGTRIIGPVFGVGLFVWSALLAVTLGSLTLGYYAGGVVADRRLQPRLLGSVVACAGLLVGLVPLSSRGVLAFAEAWGPRVGPLVSAGLLFAPPIVALGMTGPIAVKMAIRSMPEVGRQLGAVYAISTAGSLLGTLYVGFVAIPSFDPRVILACVAAALVLLGAGSLAWRHRPAALALLLGPALVGSGSRAELPPGITILAESHSLLGRVQVISDSQRGVRFLRSDHSLLGAQFERDGSSAFGFVEVLQAIRFFRPSAKRLLAIGLGSGAAPSALGREGLKVDVVEIDPAVVSFAQRYFGFSTTGAVYGEDARTFLRHTDQRYDLVIHDTFTGGTTPEHLLSLEVLQRLRQVLLPGGVLALNFVGFYGGAEAEASYAVARTLRAVFPYVRAFRDSAPSPADVAGNIVFFASSEVLDFVIPPRSQFGSESGERLQRSFTNWPVLLQVPPGPVITDAYNPLARLQLPVLEKHFAAMNRLLPLEVWID